MLTDTHPNLSSSIGKGRRCKNMNDTNKKTRDQMRECSMTFPRYGCLTGEQLPVLGQ